MGRRTQVDWAVRESPAGCCARGMSYLLVSCVTFATMIIMLVTFGEDIAEYTPHLPPEFKEESDDSAVVKAFERSMRPRLPTGYVKVNDTFDREPGCTTIGLMDTYMCWDGSPSNYMNPKHQATLNPVSMAEWEGLIGKDGCSMYPNFMTAAFAFNIIHGFMAFLMMIISFRIATAKGGMFDAIDPYRRILLLKIVLVMYAVAFVCSWLAVAFTASFCTATLCTGSNQPKPSKPLSESGSCTLLKGTTLLLVGAILSTVGPIIPMLLLYVEVKGQKWEEERQEKNRERDEEEKKNRAVAEIAAAAAKAEEEEEKRQKEEEKRQKEAEERQKKAEERQKKAEERQKKEEEWQEKKRMWELERQRNEDAVKEAEEAFERAQEKHDRALANLDQRFARIEEEARPPPPLHRHENDPRPDGNDHKERVPHRRRVPVPDNSDSDDDQRPGRKRSPVSSPDDDF